MASLNKVMLIGNTGKDCELRYTANGLATSSFSLAVNGRRKRDDGEWEDQTEWFNILLFGDTAERISQYITKGKPLYIEGRLQTRSWEDDDGVRRYRTEVVANTVQLLGTRDDRRDEPPDYAIGMSGEQRAYRYERAIEKREAQRAVREQQSAGGGTRQPGSYTQAAIAQAEQLGVSLDDLPFE